MSRSETLTVRCHACPSSLSITVSLPFWHDRTKYCADRCAEILGFVLTDKGPACVVHGGGK